MKLGNQIKFFGNDMITAFMPRLYAKLFSSNHY